MSGANEREFRTRLSNDESLNSKVEEVRLLLTGIGAATLEQQLDQFHASITGEASTTETSTVPEKHTIKPRSRYFRLLAAASVALVIILAIVLLAGPNKDRKLFTRFYEPDPGLATAMSASEDYAFNRAMIDYKTENYDSAIGTWTQLLQSKAGNDTLHYFLGVAFLAKDEDDSAAFHLRRTLELPDTTFHSDASWFLGLIYLKQGKKEEAASFIRQSTHPRKQELLRQLK